MANAQEFLPVFGEFFTFFMLFSVIVSMKSLRQCKNNDHTCLFKCINISLVSWKQSEPSANVNA